MLRGDLERLAELAKELVHLKVEILVASTALRPERLKNQT